MNNIERPLDDNSTVSIHDNEKLKQVERKEAKKEKKSGITIRELTIIGLLAGITIALGLSGYGIIPLGPLNVTTLHVPTLIGAIVEGPKVGAFVGFIFGCPNILNSLIDCQFTPLLLFVAISKMVIKFDSGEHKYIEA